MRIIKTVARTVPLESIKIRRAKAVAVNVPVDNTPSPDNHRARHAVLGSMPRVQLQPVVKTVMQANIRPMIRQPRIPAPHALLGRTLSTHNPRATIVQAGGFRLQVIQRMRSARRALLGRTLSTHNPRATTVQMDNTRHQVIRHTQSACTVPPDTLS